MGLFDQANLSSTRDRTACTPYNIDEHRTRILFWIGVHVIPCWCSRTCLLHQRAWWTGSETTQTFLVLADFMMIPIRLYCARMMIDGHVRSNVSPTRDRTAVQHRGTSNTYFLVLGACYTVVDWPAAYQL